MGRTGFAQLPLHTGRAPRYLFERMVPLAREIMIFIVSEFGRTEALRRLSDPYWFQAFGCVLGFDWHSSGLTTTVCGALKQGLREAESELGIYGAGGKGAASRKTPAEIAASCDRLGRDPTSLIYASRMSAKVDSAAVQDINPNHLRKVLLRTFEARPMDFESLLAMDGVGAKTLRALALTSELIYGIRSSWMDPTRFSFTHGGKDSTPYAVDRQTYDQTIDLLHRALNRAHLARAEKVTAFRRLASFVDERAKSGSLPCFDQLA